MSAQSGRDMPSRARPRAFDTILYGGLIVGVLDGLYAVVASGLRGVSPTRVFQYISSALLGRAAFDGGFKIALLGGLLHFLIAFLIAAVYYVASLAFPTLIRRAVLWGLLYGAAVYFVMNYFVLPLSAAPRVPFIFAGFVIGVIRTRAGRRSARCAHRASIGQTHLARLSKARLIFVS